MITTKQKHNALSQQITAIYCIVDDTLKAMGKKDDIRSQLSNAEIITIAPALARVPRVCVSRRPA